MMLAAGNSHEDIIKVLIEFGADIKCKDEWGLTPLHEACREGWLEVVKMQGM